MKSDAVLINGGRGGTVVTDDLLAVLQTGPLWGGLDVTNPEPLPPDHPLHREPRCLLTAHYAGGYRWPPAAAMDIFINNLKRYPAG